MLRTTYFICAQLFLAQFLSTVCKAELMDDEETFPDFPEGQDLTRIMWAHAVNSKALLREALNNAAQMIEADVSLGYLINDGNKTIQPIMAHPPHDSSDLSLEDFLKTVTDSKTDKGIKLDFKTTKAFKASESILKHFFDNNFGLNVWLNADILPGPIKAQTEPVDADYFLSTAVSKFPYVTLSVGWTTRYGGNIRTGSYTPDNISNMTDALNRNSVMDQMVTFPVRAGLAAQSHDALVALIETSIRGTTLTIWDSSNGKDYVDIPALRKLITDIGRDRIYLDLPDDMIQKINSDSGSGSPSLRPLVGLLSVAFGLFFVL